MTHVTEAFWRNRRVLVTGHTGFKGAWLVTWLEMMGARVAACALPPATSPSLHALVASHLGTSEALLDIRDAAAVARFVSAADPEIVLHLAAQPLVRASYRDPLETFETNVLGTAHVLNALRGLTNLRAAVMVTTDKVYENHGLAVPFVEQDRLGGKDPYSNSKACAELVTQCWRDSFLGDVGPVATARAGNVVGGGDWSEDRLVPDLVRAMLAKEPVVLRYPGATRPWQHVLEALSGYLVLAERLAQGGQDLPLAYNFGPNPDAELAVSEVVDIMNGELGVTAGWVLAPGDHPAEAKALALDSALARDALGWQPRLSMRETMAWTAKWYRAWSDGADALRITREQIQQYCSL